MDTSAPAESFRDLLLRYRGRTGLTQHEFADRVGVHRRSVQEWELGAGHPSAERLQGLIAALLGAGGLTPGHEAAEAHALWAAVRDEAPRMHTPVDQVWLARLLAERGAEQGAVERRQAWGEAPDTVGFVGRAHELAVLRRWVLDERCRLVAVLGMGGIGKTMLAAKLANDVAPSFERVYWRSLRDAPPISGWLAAPSACCRISN